MPSVNRKQLDNLSKLINGISTNAKAGLVAELKTIDIRDLNKVLEVMNRWCGIATDAAAIANSEWYKLVRAQFVDEAYEPTRESGRIEEATIEATKAAYGSSKGNAARLHAALAQRLDYEVRRAAGDNTFINGQKDGRVKKYARVPSGAETCRFCLMLASRGFVYDNELQAGALDHYHASCDCRIVPSWGLNGHVRGYDPNELYNKWSTLMRQDAEAAAKRNGTSVEDEELRQRKALADSARRAKIRAKLREQQRKRSN